MNAAEKAMLAKKKIEDSKVTDWFHEAQHYHGIFMDKLNAIKAYKQQRNSGIRYYRIGEEITNPGCITVEENACLKKAIKLYKKCAKRGHADSMECLAFIYQDCPGFQNKKKMFKWYLKGAESGNLTCMHNVGVCYQDGAGVKMSYTKAQFWFDKEEQANNG